jgi:glycosyltransferase involved in cell wall biosynthesis
MIYFSFIVPVYKVEEEYLRICIESLIGIKNDNIEIIMIDDGSPDNCGEICDEYARTDNRMTVIHKENGGVSSARNEGIKIAKGKYITFIDSDDWVDSDKMMKILDRIKDSDEDVVMYGQYIDFNGIAPIEVRPFKEDKFFTEESEIKNLHKMVFVRGYGTMKTDGGAGVVCNTVDKFIKKELIVDNKLFYDSNFAQHEDNLFNLKLFFKCKDARYIDICAYHYRMRAASAYHAITIGYNSVVSFVGEAKMVLKENNADDSFYEALSYRCYDLIFEQFDRAYLDTKTYGIFKKCSLLTKELKGEPFKSSIKTVRYKYFKFREKIILALFKCNLSSIFLLYKQFKKSVKKDRKQSLFY